MSTRPFREPMTPVSVAVDLDTHTRLRQMARARDVTISTLVRELLAAALSAPDQTSAPSIPAPTSTSASKKRRAPVAATSATAAHAVA